MLKADIGHTGTEGQLRADRDGPAVRAENVNFLQPRNRKAVPMYADINMA